MTTRRALLQGLALVSATSVIRPSLVNAALPGDRRFVLVLLRGGMDGLSVVVPYGDPAYAKARGALALGAPGTAGGSLRLDNLFGLHPALKALHARYLAGEALFVHASATPYRERSHFDAQDILENGTAIPLGAKDGWLNRALAAAAQGNKPVKGLAIGQGVPLVLRGAAEVTSWAPAVLPPVDNDTLARLADLYAGDRVLGPALADALATDALVAGAGGMPRRPKGYGPQAGVEVARMAGKFLAEPDGPRVVVLDIGGFDTHANEGAANGLLSLRLAALDQAFEALAEALGPVWQKTAVLAVTEFGRTVAANGTRGTDHGIAGAALLFGGAVKGGRVLADWPGLSTSALYEGRDLAPTLDLRALMKGVLAAQFGLSDAVLGARVFPDSAAVKPLTDVIRA